MKKINSKYFLFLLLTVFKKKSIWIVGALYLFVISIWIYIVPTIAHQSPFIVWSNDTISIQSMTCYFSAIFSSILVLSIYKDFRDNGTELLIVSKPISRNYILLIKMAVYFIYSIVLSFAAFILGLFIFCFDVPTAKQWALTGNLFLITLIFLIIFGAIALIVSIYLNKIWVILFSVLVCAFSNIYYVVINYADVVKTPTDQLVAGGDTTVSTITYLNNDGNTHSSYSYIVSKKDAEDSLMEIGQALLDPSNPISPLKFYEARKDDYEQKVANSNYKIPNYFNTTSQIRMMGNAFALKDNLISQSNSAFGMSRNMDYTIDRHFIVDKFDPNKNTYPIMFFDYDGMPYLSKDNARNPLEIGKWFSEDNLQSIFGSQTLTTIGSSVNITNSFSKLTSSMQMTDYYSFVIIYPDSRGIRYLTPNKLSIDDNEKSFFDTLLRSPNQINFKWYDGSNGASLPKGLIPGQIEADAANKPFTNVKTESSEGQEIQTFINNSSSFNFDSPYLKPVKNDGSSVTFTNFSDYIHYCLLNQISNDDSSWKSLNIKTNEDLMFEALKFKYYVLTNEYSPKSKSAGMQQYLNKYFNDFSQKHDAVGFEDFVFPFTGILLTPGEPNNMYYDDEYIAISTITKNFSLAADKLGYATDRKYDNKYLDPEDFAMRKGGNIGIISTSTDSAFTTDFFGFTFHSSIEFSPEALYLIYTFIALAMFAIAYVIYSRIDFK